MKRLLSNRASHWVVTVFLCLPVQRGAAQFVDLTAEIETTVWSSASPSVRSWAARCVVGTNGWRMDGEFLRDGKDSWWFTGTNLVEHHLRTKPVGPFPAGSRYTRMHGSVDGNPGKPPRAADLMFLPARLSWLAFCSSACLRSDGRRIFPPSDLWKELVTAPSGFADKTSVFEDALGLPKSVTLHATNGQPVFQYQVTASTNVLGWEFPLEFHAAQYRPAYMPNTNRFGTNVWELHFTARGRLTAIGVGTEPEIPPEVLRASEN